MAAPSEPGAEVAGVPAAGQMYMRRRLNHLQRLIDVDDDPALNALENSDVQRQLGSGRLESGRSIGIVHEMEQYGRGRNDYQ